MHVDPAQLARELGVPVVETVGGAARRRDGAAAAPRAHAADGRAAASASKCSRRRARTSRRRSAKCGASSMRIGYREAARSARAGDAIDRIVLHPVLGSLLLAVMLFLMFQAVFSWADAARWS